MIGADLKLVVFTQEPKSYVFHVSITTANYKATLFDYQTVNQASMAMVRGLTRSSRVYDLSRKEGAEGTQQQFEPSKEEGEERAALTRIMKASEYRIAD